MKIACLGPEYSFSDEAAKLRFPSVERLLLGNLKDVIPAVEAGDATHALVPFCNLSSKRTDFPFPDVFATIARANTLHAVDAFKFPVQWCAASTETIEPREGRRLYTFRQGQGQCSIFVRRMTLAGCVLDTTPTSTADAVAMAAADPGSIALGSEGAALSGGFREIVRNVQDREDNATWFFGVTKGIHDNHDDSCSVLVSSRGGGTDFATLLEREGLHADLKSLWQFKEIDLDVRELKMAATEPVVSEIVAALQRDRGSARLMGCIGDYDRAGMAEV